MHFDEEKAGFRIPPRQVTSLRHLLTRQRDAKIQLGKEALRGDTVCM